jgi:hypothetical protein
MNRSTMTAIVVFIVTGIIVGAILQFIIHVSGAIIKLGISGVIALIVAGVAFAMLNKTPEQPS